jgi:hypothetical protein
MVNLQHNCEPIASSYLKRFRSRRSRPTIQLRNKLSDGQPFATLIPQATGTSNISMTTAAVT